jgi:hypothetical protein
MQKYDVALKNLLTRGGSGFLSRLMGLEVANFLNVNLPEVRTYQPDLLGEARDGTLFHVELQSTNDSRMAFRMLAYLVAIELKCKSVPRQLVLYVGEAAMRMENQITAGGLLFEVKMVDIRELDGKNLLESDSLDDNILSILARQPDGRVAVRRILAKIAASTPEYRAQALQELTLLAGLRSLGGFVKEESQKMPILTDIMDHDLYGPMIRQGMATGRVEGERALFQRLVAKRFGTPPDWVSQRVGELEVEELEDLYVRLLDARSLDELFGAA